MGDFFKVGKPIFLDFLSTIAFIVAVSVLHDVALSILIGMAVGIAEIGWQYLRHKKISAMEGASLALVIVLGAASLITKDPRFVMLKPSIGYGAIGMVMLQRDWQLRYAPPRALVFVPAERFIFWGRLWAALMWISCFDNLALISLVDLATWSKILSIWGLSTKLSLFVAEYFLIRAEAIGNYRKGVRFAEEPA